MSDPTVPFENVVNIAHGVASGELSRDEAVALVDLDEALG